MMRPLPRQWIVAVLCAASALAQAAEPQAARPTVREAWARATPPGMSMGAVYLTVLGGAKPDRLESATTPRAATTQLHVVTVADGMSRMREAAAVDVPSGATVALAPQGTHLMLIDLTQPLVAGERFELTVRFAAAGQQTVSVRVVAPGNEPAPRP